MECQSRNPRDSLGADFSREPVFIQDVEVATGGLSSCHALLDIAVVVSAPHALELLSLPFNIHAAGSLSTRRDVLRQRVTAAKNRDPAPSDQFTKVFHDQSTGSIHLAYCIYVNMCLGARVNDTWWNSYQCPVSTGLKIQSGNMQTAGDVGSHVFAMFFVETANMWMV